MIAKAHKKKEETRRRGVERKWLSVGKYTRVKRKERAKEKGERMRERERERKRKKTENVMCASDCSPINSKPTGLFKLYFFPVRVSGD